MHHPQVVQSQNFNDCLKVKIDGHTEPQLVPIVLLEVSVRELYNNLAGAKISCGLKESRDEDDNIIISYYTLRPLLPPQLKNIPSICKVMCGCECCISAKIIHSSSISWCDSYLRKLKDISQNTQNRSSGGKINIIYETYKNTVKP